jgi:hypothetical protein
MLLMPILGLQIDQFGKMQAAQPRRKAWWIAPVLCGAPIAYITLAAMVIPLEPREVCERFLGATATQERTKYATPRLRTALENADRGGAPSHECPSELVVTEWPEFFEMSIFIINWRSADSAGRSGRIEGSLVLARSEDRKQWKVDDVVISRLDGQALEPNLTWSQDSLTRVLPLPGARCPWYARGTLLRGVWLIKEMQRKGN